MRSRFFVLIFFISFLIFSNKVFALYDTDYSYTYDYCVLATLGTSQCKYNFKATATINESGFHLVYFGDGIENYPKHEFFEEFPRSEYPYWIYLIDDNYIHVFFSKTPIYFRRITNNTNVGMEWYQFTDEEGKTLENLNQHISFSTGSTNSLRSPTLKNKGSSHDVGDVMVKSGKFGFWTAEDFIGEDNYAGFTKFLTNNVVRDYHSKNRIIDEEDCFPQLVSYEYSVTLEDIILNENNVVTSYRFLVHLTNWDKYFVSYYYGDDENKGHVSLSSSKSSDDFFVDISVNGKVTFKLFEKGSNIAKVTSTFDVDKIGLYFDEDTKEYTKELNKKTTTKDEYVDEFVGSIAEGEVDNDGDGVPDNEQQTTDDVLDLILRFFKLRFPIIWQFISIHDAWDFNVNRDSVTEYNGCLHIGADYEEGGEVSYMSRPYCNRIPSIDINLWGINLVDVDVIDTYWYWKYRDVVFFFIKFSLASFTFFKCFRIIRSDL